MPFINKLFKNIRPILPARSPGNVSSILKRSLFWPASTSVIGQSQIKAREESSKRATRRATTDAVVEEIDIKSFQLKSVKDLMRTWLILRLSSIDFFVDNSEKLMLFTKRLLGRRISDAILRATFYGQFGGGETWDTLKVNARLLKENGIRSMMCIPLENFKDDNITWDDFWRNNTEIIRECIEMTDEVEKYGFSQMRISALCSHDLLSEMTKHLVAHECDHKEPPEWDIKHLGELFKAGRYQDIEIPSLSTEHNVQLRELLKRMDSLAKACADRKIRFMIDAEQTYIQSALGYIILLLQMKVNQGVPVVYGTYQCYRKDTLPRIQADHNLAKANGFKIAGKLVRGAYMMEEQRIARENGTEDPICEGFDKTTENYHSIVDFMLSLVKTREAGVMFATHNESTILYSLKRMQEMGIDRDNELLCFAQLYGMCDHVTEGLAKTGSQVYKSVPFGTIDSTLLYLVRRAHENRSVMERGVYERKLIFNEVFQRLTGFQRT